MSPHVIDVDQRGAAMQWSHSADRKVVGPIKVVGDLISRGDQSAKGATPLCPAIRWTYGQGIDVSCELTTAPVPLIFYESPSLFDDLSLEWLRHDNALSLQLQFVSVSLFFPQCDREFSYHRFHEGSFQMCGLLPGSCRDSLALFSGASANGTKRTYSASLRLPARTLINVAHLHVFPAKVCGDVCRHDSAQMQR
jgi:hypothetical protein